MTNRRLIEPPFPSAFSDADLRRALNAPPRVRFRKRPAKAAKGPAKAAKGWGQQPPPYRRKKAGRPVGYDRCVFINTPFDSSYDPIATAIFFTVFECGLVPRSAKESDDSSETRIERLYRLIRNSRYSIHDISRTQLSDEQLPRFNMPFELGLFLGFKAAGTGNQKRKIALVLDSTRYRYQVFLSDIAGQDIRAHGNQVARVIREVRHWHVSRAAHVAVAGGNAINHKFSRFGRRLPGMCAALDLDVDDLQFNDLCWLIEMFLEADDRGELAGSERSKKTSLGLKQKVKARRGVGRSRPAR